jgi:drug/metabolite transporter (DMT)-like permease
MTARRYLVLLAIIFSAAIGDILLSVGMKQIGAISPARWLDLLFAVRNPFVALGILCLLIFFGSYLTALSWADLTFVLPATALGYVVVALLSKFFLHENVTTSRWLGIALISAGVGFVANGPALTGNRGQVTGDGEDKDTQGRTA